MTLAKKSNFDFFFFFKAACHANPGAEKNSAGSSSYISRHKFSNTSANNNVSLWIYKLWYAPKFFISKSSQTLFACA